MKALTEKIPKALIEVQGVPFLKHQLDHLIQQGITRVVLSVGYKGQMIREFLSASGPWKIPIDIVDEGDHLRGTAGALRLALETGKLPERFFVLYGDSYLPIDFRAVWTSFLQSGKPALMTVVQNEERWDASNACFDGQRVTLYKKGLKDNKPPAMRYIDYGLSALRRMVIADEVVPGKRADLADLFHALSLRGELAGFEIHTRFFEIGSPDGLNDFVRYLRDKRS